MSLVVVKGITLHLFLSLMAQREQNTIGVMTKGQQCLLHVQWMMVDVGLQAVVRE